MQGVRAPSSADLKTPSFLPMQRRVADKIIKLRWAASCSACGTSLSAGTRALWDSEQKAARCKECPPATAAVAEAPPVPVAAEPAPLETGTAGASARREGARRAEQSVVVQEATIERDRAWREDVHERHPLLGRLVTMTTPKPPPVHETRNTRVWAQGAAGEERLGAVLDATDGIIALHDRRIPKTKANIDHLVIGPSGVFVIDAKNYSGVVECRDVGGWLRPDERLYVGGRDRTKLIDGVLWQVQQVRAALGESPVPIYAYLCFTGPNWRRFFTRPLLVGGVGIAWPSKMAEFAAGEGALGGDEMQAVAAHLGAALMPA